MASVLETFLILFKTDADDAVEGVDALGDALGDAEGAAEGATEAGDTAGAAFLEMGQSALGAVAGVFALGAVIAGTLEKTKDLTALGNFSKFLGEDVGDVDSWGKAVERAGGTADDFQSTISGLNEKMVEASLKGTSSLLPYFNQLGISMLNADGSARSFTDALPEIAQAFEGLTKQQSAAIGKGMGLDQGTILLLQSGRREVEALVKKQRELGVASKEAVEVSKTFNNALSDFKQSLGFSSQSILVDFLPAVTYMLEVFTDISQWMGKNEVLVQGFFIGFGLAISKFALPPLISLASAAFAAAAPFLLIGLAIVAVSAAFALLYEDVSAFMNGQDSLIGDIAKKWPIVGEVVKSLVGDIKQVISSFESMAEFLTELFTNPTKALKEFKQFAQDLGTGLKSFFGYGDQPETEALSAIGGASSNRLGSASPNGLPAGGASNRNSSVQTGDIIINTQATDSEGIASEAANSINNQLRITVDNFDDGVTI